MDSAALMHTLIPLAGMVTGVIAILLPALIVFIVLYYKHQRKRSGQKIGQGIDANIQDARSASDEEVVDHGPAQRGQALRIDVQTAVARLPEAEQLAITHCYHLELSHEEAAVVLGWPLGTLKSHVARAKAHLRQALLAWQPQR